MKIRRASHQLFSLVLSLCLLAGMLVPSASAYTHESEFSKGYTITKGIDVSHHQGDINWAKVRKAGIKFALIRCGYTSLSKFSRNTDREFARNMKNAEANGIQIGIYYFSQAKSTAEAEKEAQYVISLLKNYHVDLPVFFDEESENSSYRFQWKKYSKTQCTNFALAFCKKIKAAGYKTGVYNSVSTFSGSGAKYDPQKILDAGHALWVAHYANRANNSTYHVNGFTYWQYTSSGKVSGISGNVDLDFRYQKNSAAPDVEKCVEVEDDTAITSLQLDHSSLNLAGGGTAQLSATVKPSNTKDGVIWSSSDDSVAYVDADGTVTGVQSGSATVTAASSNGAVKATCAVTVSAEGAAEEVCAVTYGDSAFSLEEKLGLGAERYVPQRDSVAEVTEDGKVTILGAGVTDITAQIPGSGPDVESPDASTEAVQPEEVPEQPDETAAQEPEGEASAEPQAESAAGEEELSSEVQPADEPAPADESAPEEAEQDAEQPAPVEPEEAPAVEPAEAEPEAKTIRLVVRRCSLSGATVTLAGSTCSYTGEARNASVTSVVKNGVTIPADGYWLYCNNNINRGKASVAVIGRGNYAGVVRKSYYIRSKQKIYAPKSSYSKVIGSSAFGLGAKNISQYGAKLTYKSSNPKVAAVSNAGKVTLKRVGIATITVTAAQNDRYTAVKKTIRINVTPKKVSLSSLSAGKKKLTVKWKTTSGSGYQVQYSTKSNFPSGSTKTKTLSGSGKKSQTLSGLGAKKRYYVRVRAYYHSSSGTNYGAWSAVKSQKTK